RSIAVAITQNGPINMRHEAVARSTSPQNDDRAVVEGLEASGGGVTVGAHIRASVLKAENRRVELGVGKKVRWAAQVNKWFACVTAPEASTQPNPLKLI